MPEPAFAGLPHSIGSGIAASGGASAFEEKRCFQKPINHLPKMFFRAFSG
jgi:hypothetical protein